MGTKGTVLMIHASSQDYEVEFVDEFHNTLGVETVNAKVLKLEIRPCKSNGLGLTRESRE